MDRAYSVLRFALLQVLMFAVCASECPEGVSVDCPNTTGPVGEALNLTCLVTYDTTVLKKVYTEAHKLRKNEIEIKMNNYSSSVKNETFYHTIENLSAENYGTYKFWIQLNNGLCAKYFTVTQAGLSVPATASLSGPLVPATASPSAGPSVPAIASDPELLKDETKTHVGVWFTMAFLAIVAIAVVLYTKRKEICHLFQPNLPHSQDTLLDTP